MVELQNVHMARHVSRLCRVITWRRRNKLIRHAPSLLSKVSFIIRERFMEKITDAQQAVFMLAGWCNFECCNFLAAKSVTLTMFDITNKKGWCGHLSITSYSKVPLYCVMVDLDSKIPHGGLFERRCKMHDLCKSQICRRGI